jgi:hypothetical protein
LTFSLKRFRIIFIRSYNIRINIAAGILEVNTIIAGFYRRQAQTSKMFGLYDDGYEEIREKIFVSCNSIKSNVFKNVLETMKIRGMLCRLHLKK